MNIYECAGQSPPPGAIATHLKEEVDKVGVLLQFGTDYTEELNLLIFCRSSQHLATQTDQFLTKNVTATEKRRKHCTTCWLTDHFEEKDYKKIH